VLVATPVNLGRILEIDKPSLRVTYEAEEVSSPRLTEILREFAERHEHQRARLALAP